jgi:hypothetical protein
MLLKKFRERVRKIQEDLERSRRDEERLQVCNQRRHGRPSSE